jgi:hypothetical protein
MKNDLIASLPKLCQEFADGVCINPTPTPLPAYAAALNSPIFTFGLAVVFLLCWGGSIILAIVGIYTWALSKKDQVRSAKGKKLVTVGIIGFILTFLVFIAINIIMNALGLGRITQLT